MKTESIDLTNLKYTDIFKDPSKISLELLWKIHSNQIFKGMKVSETQHQETKEAYCCGFTEAIKLMDDIANELDENQATNVLTKIYRDSNNFVNEMISKKITKQQGKPEDRN